MKFKIIFLIALLKLKRFGYIDFVRCKITELALVGYYYKGAYSPLRAFFMRSNSMRSHFMAELERDTFGCAGNLVSLSVNPFQLCHHYLTVIGKASISLGAHSHA